MRSWTVRLQDLEAFRAQDFRGLVWTKALTLSAAPVTGNTARFRAAPIAEVSIAGFATGAFARPLASKALFLARSFVFCLAFQDLTETKS